MRTRFWQKVCIWRSMQQRGWQTNFQRKVGQSMVLISCSKSCGYRHSWQAARQWQIVQCPHWKKAKLLTSEVPTVCHWLCSANCQVKWPRTLFVRKENKVSGRLRELLKKKLSALHASSGVRVCQLLCTASLETFQTQVLTNNPGHRRLMNTHLTWYHTACPVGLRLVLLTQD